MISFYDFQQGLEKRFGVGEIDFFLPRRILFAFFSRVLTELNLCGNAIGDEGAKALAAAFRVNGVLTSLDLRANRICGLDWRGRGSYSAAGITALAEALKVNGVLKSIDLRYNNLGDEGKGAIHAAVSGRECEWVDLKM